MNTDDFAKFLFFWAAEGNLTRTAGELLPVAERAGLELKGRSLRGRQIALGMWLSLQTGSPVIYSGFRYSIRREFKLGQTWYSIHADPVRSDDRQ